ncbi:MAG TPA: ABC transporter ATP-binding protein [Sphingomonas sp.]|jgi:iron complex transport system ATP-binding protein|uniref:ABC transporter ATP-binding protein n=1 Tax=Sphingomonas sp. TaxID=28214 RepID=UPI002EDA289E
MDLIFDRLSVSLGRRPVLDAVDARLQPGRVTAILGPNGAGKSTLLKAAAALVPLAAGAVRIGDWRIPALDPRKRAQLIGYLPQDGPVHWNMVARDLVALGRLSHRSPFAAPSPEDEAAVARALAATDTAAFADRPVGALSGGERARVLLARALAGEPRWLLADEPLASLDPAHQADLLDRLRSFAGEGKGVAIVLHDLVHAQRAADDVLLLHRGRVVAFGPPAEVVTPDIVRAVFGVRVVAARDGERDFWVPAGR